MGDQVTFPPGLASMLETEKATWHQVWKPLKKAIESGQNTKFSFNVSGYGYDADTDMITVHGLLVDDGEVQLTKDNFRENMAKYLRGTPEC